MRGSPSAIADSLRPETTEKLFINLFIEYIPYFFLGRLIGKTELRFSALLLWGVFLLSVVMTAIGAYLADLTKSHHVDSYFYENNSINAILMSSAAFLLFKSTNATMIGIRLVEVILPIVFGLYLIHPLILEVLVYPMRNAELPSVFIIMPALFLAMSIISALISLVIIRVPYLRRVI